MTRQPQRPLFIRIPPGAQPGLPVVIDRLDGLNRVLHVDQPHSHGFFSLAFVVAGSGEMVTARGTFTVQPGCLILTPPGEIHDTTGLRGVDRWGVSFNPDALGTGAAAWLFPTSEQPEWLALLRRSSTSARPVPVPASLRSTVEAHFRELATEIAGRQRGYIEAVRAHLKLLLILAARVVAPPGTPEPRSSLIDEVFRVIEARFAGQLSLALVARLVGRSAAHLTTVVRAQTGLSVQQWVIERRMAEARQRLLSTDENVTVIAERSGYPDPSLFSRHFRRVHGMTPGDWRGGGGLESPPERPATRLDRKKVQAKGPTRQRISDG